MGGRRRVINAPKDLIRRRVNSGELTGVIMQIDDKIFTVVWSNGMVITYPIARLVVDNMMGNLTLRST